MVKTMCLVPTIRSMLRNRKRTCHVVLLGLLLGWKSVWGAVYVDEPGVLEDPVENAAVERNGEHQVLAQGGRVELIGRDLAHKVRGVEVRPTGGIVYERKPREIATLPFRVTNTSEGNIELLDEITLPEGWKPITGCTPDITFQTRENDG